MKCELSKEKLIGYFYQDLPDEELKDVKLHLKRCAACKMELTEFNKTTDILKTWPDEDPGLNLKFIREKVKKGVEAFAQAKTIRLITSEVMKEALPGAGRPKAFSKIPALGALISRGRKKHQEPGGCDDPE